HFRLLGRIRFVDTEKYGAVIEQGTVPVGAEPGTRKLQRTSHYFLIFKLEIRPQIIDETIMMGFIIIPLPIPRPNLFVCGSETVTEWFLFKFRFILLLLGV